MYHWLNTRVYMQIQTDSIGCICIHTYVIIQIRDYDFERELDGKCEELEGALRGGCDINTVLTKTFSQNC